jgi:hypothetical protein
MNTSLFTYAIATFTRHFVREAAYPSKIDGIPIELFDKAATEFKASLPDHILMRLNGRFERGLALAKKGSATAWKGEPHPQYHRLFKVASSDPFHTPYFYKVDMDEDTCECPDFMKGNYCKHVIAAHIRYQAFLLAGKMMTQPKRTEVPPSPEPAPTPIGQVEDQEETPHMDKGEYVIWAVLKQDSKYFGVEVLDIHGDNVTVKALPLISDDRKLKPHFPFPGKRVIASVNKSDFSHVKVFR